MRAKQKGMGSWVAGLSVVLTAYLVLAVCSSVHAFPHGLAAGSYHTVGLKSDGTVVAVGRNDFGQLSVGTWKLRPSYSIPGDVAPADCDVDGSDLAKLIANTSLIDLATFAQNFGKNACQ
jgi:hypothetical protein